MYRIIGILAIIGFVVILLPFFTGSKGMPSNPATVNAPPFPNQSAANNLPEPSLADAKVDTIANAATPSINSPIIDKITPEEPKPPVEQPSLVPQSTITSNDRLTKPLEDTKTPTAKTSLHPKKLLAKQTEQRKPMIALLQNPATDRSLLKLKTASWVIQLGSFKNKTNAVHLVDHLRNNGYKAFIQTAASAFGETTRVYVGPELKQTAAKDLADRLEQDMHLHGIVISFKPLAL
ncbi:MAG: hypothetical protein A3E84_01610 [Gammaproteobacteria bacterium RIFCSPHIGHO2_12_FULL_42_13]|nr:MAG: hypothetical protein A3E84_01610 [Gammaproteobacteria bacterium RIFCSPHIGHO2_12_FULL_42_13]